MRCIKCKQETDKRYLLEQHNIICFNCANKVIEELLRKKQALKTNKIKYYYGRKK